MPQGIGFSYQGMSFREQQAEQGVPNWAISGLSILFVFLILAALYESWTLPFSVLLSTPVAILGAYLALTMRSLENDIFASVGLILLIGLPANNAILIVEFAVLHYRHGKRIAESALDAARLRFRPIVMTELAFIFGCLPLWTTSGSGAVAAGKNNPPDCCRVNFLQTSFFVFRERHKVIEASFCPHPHALEKLPSELVLMEVQMPETVGFVASGGLRFR